MSDFWRREREKEERKRRKRGEREERRETRERKNLEKEHISRNTRKRTPLKKS